MKKKNKKRDKEMNGHVISGRVNDRFFILFFLWSFGDATGG